MFVGSGHLEFQEEEEEEEEAILNLLAGYKPPTKRAVLRDKEFRVKCSQEISSDDRNK
jgi:hypothetical protein